MTQWAELERSLNRTAIESPALFDAAAIQRVTVWVTMRDGVRLATDLYVPPQVPAPVLATRSPYGRATPQLTPMFTALAQRGFVVIAQDVRGTGDSEPASWDYYMYEPEDGLDFVEWVVGQPWYGGFLGSFGSSYVAQTQWCMSTHPRMSAIVPEVSGLGVAYNTARLYMFCNAYARSVGRGQDKVDVPYDQLERLMLEQTLSGGYFNQPLQVPFAEALLESHPQIRDMPYWRAQQWLWELYCSLPCAQRAAFVKKALGTQSVSVLDVESLPAVFGQRIIHDRHTLPHVDAMQMFRSLHAPALLITGWYDWALNDALETWASLTQSAREPVLSRSRLIITPSAHNAPGYHEGEGQHPELQHSHRVPNHVDLLLQWYGAVREDALDDWPRVIYYLMGANEWRSAAAWPPPATELQVLYLQSSGALSPASPGETAVPRSYVYRPDDPTPTVGGSIVSYVYPPGSVDVSEVQRRPDVLVYTTDVLQEDLEIAGPLRVILYASSSAVDTDFVARLSDVFPDGRAIQLQSGLLRARYRDRDHEPSLLRPGRVYRFEIDLWATANRFKAGHRVRLDISSADFPRFDRNSNLGGACRPPQVATQTIYHDAVRPSHLLLPVIP